MRGFVEIPIIAIILLISGGVITAYTVTHRDSLIPANTNHVSEGSPSAKETIPSPETSKQAPTSDKAERSPSPTPKTTTKPSATPTPSGSSNNTSSSANNPSTSSQSSVKLDSIFPNPTKYGDTITIKGSGFGSSGQYVIFTNPQGFTSGAGVISWSETEIKATVPPTKGENKIQVEGPGGVKSNIYTLQVTEGQPYFQSIGPTSVKPGGEITIQGESFGNSTGTVNFYKPDNISSASGGSVIYSWSDTQIKANVPGIIAPNQEYGVQIQTADGRKSSFKYYQVGN